MIEYSLKIVFHTNTDIVFYATSSCSIKTKKSAKTIAGNTSVTTGVKIGGKNDAVIIIFYSNKNYYPINLLYRVF